MMVFSVDNDDKVASSKEHTQCKAGVKNHTLFETKMTKRTKKPYPLGLHIPNLRSGVFFFSRREGTPDTIT